MTIEEALKYWERRLERAEEWSDPHWEASERKAHKEYVDAMKMAIEALKAQEWTPCSEKPPEENGEYIVSLEDSVYP